MDVSLEPLGKHGSVRERITVVTNDPDEPVTNLYVTADVMHAPDVQAGPAFQALIFSDDCSGCHGAEAAGPLEGASLYAKVCAMCHPDPSRLDGDVITWTSLGSAGTGMPAYTLAEGGPLTDGQIESLDDYVRANR